MMRLVDFLFGTPKGPDDNDEAKHQVEETRRELNRRSAENRAALVEIQVAVMNRRENESD